MSDYSAIDIEKKWQKKWEKSGLHKVDMNSKKPKYYNLVMFPYPSGDKLHIGHWYNYGPHDSWGRYMRMRGHNVFEPMGFDSFGLPAENYAIKTKVPPFESTEKNVGYMIKQLKRIGTIYDWDKTLRTSHPEYYKWTQWVFLKLYEKGLAYKKKAPVNWCPSCQTVLANEQVQEGKCERCGSEATKKRLEQWFFKITDYAEELLNHDGLDWPEKTKVMQTNWIGKSEGLLFTAPIKDTKLKIQTFSAHFEAFRADTFVVIAPDHPFLEELLEGAETKNEVLKFCKKIIQKRIERGNAEEKESEGIFTGRYIVDPVGNGDLPIWVASFALADYGTGIVKCSAHDERDFAFAKKYGIKLKTVLFPKDPAERKKVEAQEYCYIDMKNGILSEPEEFAGKRAGDHRDAVVKYAEKHDLAKSLTTYKLRDWLISRQRYWGAPIPIVYDPKGVAHQVPEEHLPWTLPTDVDFKPTGESPIKQSKEFFARTEKIFGKGWTPEVDTMDTFMCSSWYFLRYPCSGMKDKAFDGKIVNKWLPVDMYIGGAEHACMHLLYARFINMALHDMGLVDFKEPFKRLVHQGMVTKDGAKMSKTKGNVVSPDEFVDRYGSDVFRMYLMFMGPFTEGGDWNDKGINGIARFVDRFWNLMESEEKVLDKDLAEKNLHKLIKKVTGDIERFHFNTAVAALMEFVNFAMKNGIDKADKKILAQLIAPLAPHLAEECWETFGGKFSVVDSEWPKFDSKLTVDDVVRIGVQINGKVRGDIEVSVKAEEEEAVSLAKANENVARYLNAGKIVKTIYVKGKILGFVVK